jgi:AcrR family transcriptional regulator
MGMTDTARPSLKERQWKLREDAILDAASELMATKGYNAMTMDDIANLVGISKATLYQHFSSKHDLVVSVACRTVDRAYEKMESISPDLPAGERVAQLVDRMVEVRYGPESPPFIEAIGELTEVLGTDHPFLQKERRNLELVMGVMQEAQKAGALIPGVSVIVAVHVISGTLRSVELERAVEASQITPAEIAESVKRMVLAKP